MKGALWVSWLSLWSELALNSHSSPACFSLVQSLAKVNSIFLFLSFFMSNQCTFFYSHVPWLVCITSVTPLALTLPIVASISYKILSSLRCCSGGRDVCYKSKRLWSNPGLPFKLSQHHLHNVIVLSLASVTSG